MLRTVSVHTGDADRTLCSYQSKTPDKFAHFFNHAPHVLPRQRLNKKKTNSTHKMNELPIIQINHK